MSVALSLSFALVAVFSVWAMWRAIAANLAPIGELHRQLREPGSCDFTVTFRDVEQGSDGQNASRQRRSRRIARPKPITHRLHHFARSRSAA